MIDRRTFDREHLQFCRNPAIGGKPAGFVARGTVVILTPAGALAVGFVMPLDGVGQAIDTVPKRPRLRLLPWVGAAAM